MNIAICGKMTSGKTTLCEALMSYDLLTAKVSFADPIRRALAEMGITKAEHPELYRKGAQYIGTDLVREYDADWWVHQFDFAIQDQTTWIGDPHVTLYCDDCRFPNEFRYLQLQGWLMVYLEVSPETQLARGAQPDRLDHASETGLDHIAKEEWDLWLPESTTVEERVGLVRTARDRYLLPSSQAKID
jgi:hypothetical protein